MKKAVLSVLIILFMIGAFSLYKFYIQKIMTENKVMAHIEEKGYQNQIKEMETKYDSKQGEYFVQIIYKDEPDNHYEYYVAHRRSPHYPVYCIGYDKHNVGIEKKEDGKYIEK